MVERVVVGPWKTNCYIYSSSKKECIIIDPGGDEEEIASRVDVLNMVPVGIALTHGHVDHVAALGRLRDNYARRGYKLPIAINTADRRFLGTGGMETHLESLEVIGMDGLTFFGDDSAEMPKADVRLREGERVFNMDVVVVETPGHTPGSVCFYSDKEGVLFSGDTVFFDGVGRTDMPGGSDKKLRDSIQHKIATLPPETRVFPGHGPFTTVEREKRSNAFFRMPPVQIHMPAPLAGKPAAAQPAAVKRPAAAKSPAAVKRPAAAKRAKVKKVVKPAQIKKTARPVKPAQAKVAAKGKKRSQATRSTKAPGAGKKPRR
jgi:hydroxyacylglutathione hydrolase